MSNAGNYGPKTAWITPAENMAAFDSLPPVLRHELQYAIGEYGAVPFHESWEWDRDAEYLLRSLREADGRQGKAMPIERTGRMSGRERRLARLATKVLTRTRMPVPRRARRAEGLNGVRRGVERGGP